ncbi:YhcH/YjgK/YiaL family protein [archaeon]|nr:YhcH/YjgK/YiaL family protein [Nanoarchaeota archaeon]MBU4451384.1 YhcH/YjgK/YiaL family protein [Nanoarchaeota archaeon]MCG2724062.1 YhcH/YjgK/YiaL family protein [archaeon]
MILGQLKNFYESNSLQKELVEAINYIKRTDFSKMAKGRYPIKGDDIYLVLDEYETLPKSEKKAEVHKKYIDVQYMISGTELMGAGFIDGKNEISEEYDEEKDRALYNKVQNESEIIFSEGMFAIFFPTDIHRPGCQFNAKENVRKAIIKVRVTL